MSEVIKRTVFFDNSKGYAIFSDWSQCLTQLGTMAEPFAFNTRRPVDIPFSDYDPSDSFARVDELVNIDIGREQFFLSCGDYHLHGGAMLPRMGR